jgi:hypothetical protein
MASQRKPAIDKPVVKKPENFDLEKGVENVKRIVKKNETWVREMAAK